MTTTVLLADVPPLLEDMVAHLVQGRADVRVVRGSLQESGIAGAAAAWNADVVIVTRPDPANLASIDATLARTAATSIVALSPDGAAACIYSLHPSCVRISNVSGDQLLEALALARPDGEA